MIDKTLVYFIHKKAFETELNSGEISDKSVVFIEETGEIWTHGKYYTNYEEIKRVLFSTGPGSVADAIKNLRKSILGGVSEEYNTLEKIEKFLKNPVGFSKGPGIDITRGDGDELIISVAIDNESIETTDEGKLKVKIIDGGQY